MSKEKLKWYAVNLVFTIVYVFCIVVMFMDALVWRPN